MNTYQRIYQVVKHIPPGQVASYGQVAKAAGLFRGARLVGWALRALPPGTDVPWQRVINQKGLITILNPHFSQVLQKELLQKEGVPIVQEADGYRVKITWMGGIAASRN